MVAASVAIMSCDKNETKVTNNDGKVRFTSGITATPGSRATIDAEGNSVWEAGDPVGIYMVEHGAADVVGENGNVKYAAGGRERPRRLRQRAPPFISRWTKPGRWTLWLTTLTMRR